MGHFPARPNFPQPSIFDPMTEMHQSSYKYLLSTPNPSLFPPSGILLQPPHLRCRCPHPLPSVLLQVLASSPSLSATSGDAAARTQGRTVAASSASSHPCWPAADPPPSAVLAVPATELPLLGLARIPAWIRVGLRFQLGSGTPVGHRSLLCREVFFSSSVRCQGTNPRY